MSDMKRLLEAMDTMAEGRSGNTITRLRTAPATPAANPAATPVDATAPAAEPAAPKIEVPQGYRAKASTGVAPMPSGETPAADPFAQKRAAAAAKAQSQMTPAPVKPVEPTPPSVWKNNRTGQVGTTPITKTQPAAAPTTTPADLGRLAGVKPALPKGVAGNEYSNMYPAMGSKFQDQQYMKDVKAQLDKYPNDPNLSAEYSDLTKKGIGQPADKLPEASTGPKFPGYWKGTDPASKAKDKMVGGCEESIIKDLHAIAESKSTEWRLEEAYRQFKEADPEYGGIDPIVRNRMGMPPASQDEIRTYLDKNPPVVTSRSGEPVKTGTGQNVQSGGQVNVAKAADAVSPDRANSVAREPGSVQVNPVADRPNNSVVVTPVPDRPNTMTSTLPAATAPVVKTAQSFNQAFASARANQMKADPANPSGGRFNWNGKTYHTGRADDVKPTVTKPVVAPTAPAAKPVATPAKTAYTPPADYVPNGKTSPTGHQWEPITYNSREKAGEKPAAPVAPAAAPAASAPAPTNTTPPETKPKIKPFRRFNEQDDEKIAGRYDPDDFDELVRRVGQKAKEQDRKHGPVDIAALAKRLRDFELNDRKQTKEQEDPATNKQDPDSQVTSQTSTTQDPAAVQQQQIDQQQNFATAKGTMSGLKTALGPRVDTNQLTNAVTKISSGQALTGPEATSMSALTPLIAKAAQTPQTAMALKTALSNASMIAKQGK